jgi:organic hydroperoxide reductase OsmC/OhrA
LSTHAATVRWALDGDFAKRRYSRLHTVDFGHGVVVPGSASPSVVPEPYASHAAMDPEAAFVASLSACHMLWFLDHAYQKGFVVERYEDAADGTLAKGTSGKMVMTRVVLRPAVAFTGERLPTEAEVDALHHAAHDDCFIANSVTTEVVVEARASV